MNGWSLKKRVINLFDKKYKDMQKKICINAKIETMKQFKITYEKYSFLIKLNYFNYTKETFKDIIS